MPLLYESHCHTPLCRHAKGEPEEYAARAIERGLAGITITCHGPTPREWGYCIRPNEWPTYLAMCQRARDAYAGRLDVRTGLECDYLPDLEPYWADFLSRANGQLSYVLGSVHPHTEGYRSIYWTDDLLAYQKLYFEHLARAAETHLFDTLSHPDLVRDTRPQEWDVHRILPDIQRALDRIARTGVAMEMNTAGLMDEVPQSSPGPVMLREMAMRGIPVVLGSDAHEPWRVASGYEQGLKILADCGYKRISLFINRQRQEIDLHLALASLKNAPTPAAKTPGQS